MLLFEQTDTELHIEKSHISNKMAELIWTETLVVILPHPKQFQIDSFLFIIHILFKKGRAVLDKDISFSVL